MKKKKSESYMRYVDWSRCIVSHSRVRDHGGENMMSILPKLVRIDKCTEYKSYLNIFGNRVNWRAGCRNYAAKSTNPIAYKIRLALPVDYNKVVTFMNDAFYKHEPIMVNLGLHMQEPAPSLIKLMYQQVEEGMTIIAETEDNSIIGAAVNSISDSQNPDDLIEFARRNESGPSRHVIEFMAYISRKPDLWKRYHVSKIFECSCLAVGPDFQGFGIARKLVLRSWYLARNCGYRLFRIDCTSRYSAMIAAGFGWKQVWTIPYNCYIKDGERIFQNIQEPHTEVQVYIDQLRKNDLPIKNQIK